MILGFILIFVTGRAFYQLAHEYGKNTWGYAIAGVVSYYAVTIVSAFVLAIIVELFSPGTITESNEKFFGYLAIPFGVLACWGFYKWLKSSWERNRQPGETLDTLDGDMMSGSNDTISQEDNPTFR
jgi:amino acid permease